jgi:hypothetical protein
MGECAAEEFLLWKGRVGRVERVPPHEIVKKWWDSLHSSHSTNRFRDRNFLVDAMKVGARLA